MQSWCGQPWKTKSDNRLIHQIVQFIFKPTWAKVNSVESFIRTLEHELDSLGVDDGLPVDL